jgi:hypothetical protein
LLFALVQKSAQFRIFFIIGAIRSTAAGGIFETAMHGITFRDRHPRARRLWNEKVPETLREGGTWPIRVSRWTQKSRMVGSNI